MKRLLQTLLSLFLFLCMSAAQTAIVARNVNLRPTPSTDNDPIEKLDPGTQLQLLEPNPTNGFLHVRVNGQTGWVWSNNVRVQQVSSPTSGETAPSAVSPAATTISADWAKPNPHDAVFHSAEGDCGETGKGGDSDTNKRKNRIDVPDAYHSVTWDAINSLQYPKGAPKSRMDWSQDQFGQILPFEGAAVSVEGYLYKVKVESTSPNAAHGGESTNCHARLADDVDWHMPLTAHVGEAEDVAIIVETTPRVRRDHASWTTARLKPWTAHVGSHPNANYNHQRVRISGWLMLDPEHQDMIDRGLRSTLWEVHPITKIEVWDAGQWVDLDSQP